MSWNLIYYGSFNENVNEDKVDIYIKQEGFSGSPEELVLDANPLTIAYPTKEWDTQIFGSGAKINIINTSGDFYKYDSLFSVPEKSNYIEIIKTPISGDPSIFLFQGYVIPEMYTSKLGKNISLTIPASDRLATLDRYTPAILIDTSIWRSEEYVNANDLLLTMLMDADVTDKIAIHNTLENMNYVKADDALTYQKDVITFSGTGTVGWSVTISVNGATGTWYLDEDPHNTFINAYQATFNDVSINLSLDGANGIAFTSTVLGMAFTPAINVVNTHPTLIASINHVSGSHNVPDTVFDNIFFQTDNFADNVGPQTNKVCMEKILKSFYSRVFYQNGKWQIERVSDLGKDNKQYALYLPDTPTTYWDVSNNRVNLSCYNHEIISGSPEITYNPGYNKIVVNLKYKQPESLVENYWYDIHPLDPSRASVALRPEPDFREWMISSKSLTNYKGTWDGFFSVPSTSCWTWPEQISSFDNGNATQWMYSGIWGTAEGRANWANLQTLSTMIQFTPMVENEPLVITVKYKVVTDKWQSGTLGNGDALQTRFALRAVDHNGVDWWIARSKPGDTSTYWKSTPYTFDVSVLYDELLANMTEDNWLLMEVSQDVNISSPILTDVSICKARKRRRNSISINDSVFFYKTLFNRWTTYEYTVPVNPEYIGQLYLDVYMLQRAWPTTPADWVNSFHPYYGYFGDFDVDIKVKTPNAYMEASMGYWYNILNKDLDVFDTSTIMHTNGIYNCDPDLNLRSIRGWRDKDADNYISLQSKYIEDMAQMASKPKYSFSVDVRSKDSSIFNLGQIFTHDAIHYPDSSLMEFMCNGLQYNVKENTYRLDLLEYIDDDNWRVES